MHCNAGIIDDKGLNRTLKWICIISFCRWSSYLISVVWDSILISLRTLSNEFLNTWCEGGIPFFLRLEIFFHNASIFVRIRMSSPNSFRVILLCPSIVCSVAFAVTCDNRPLRIIFKLPLWEAEDTFKADTSYSLINAILSFTIFPLSLIFLLFIQFTSNSLLHYNSHHIF